MNLAEESEWLTFLDIHFLKNESKSLLIQQLLTLFFEKMMNEKPLEVKLPFWQNPQCHIFTEYCDDHLNVYFSCWKKQAKIAPNFLGCITFINPSFCKVSKVYQYFPDQEFKYKSSICMVENSLALSTYLKEVGHGISSLLQSQRHYIVSSHAQQITIFAEQHIFSKKKKKDISKYIYKKVMF